jgi:hypothetical protein
MCRNSMLDAPTFVTQNGDAVNLTTETGESYRAWPDWTAPYGRIWIDARDEGAVYSKLTVSNHLLQTSMTRSSGARNTRVNARSVGKAEVAGISWNHICSTRGSEENGMETMKIHVLERALTVACVVAAIAVIWWGFKILAA